jgi:hypothetical protein
MKVITGIAMHTPIAIRMPLGVIRTAMEAAQPLHNLLHAVCSVCKMERKAAFLDNNANLRASQGPKAKLAGQQTGCSLLMTNSKPVPIKSM